MGHCTTTFQKLKIALSSIPVLAQFIHQERQCMLQHPRLSLFFLMRTSQRRRRLNKNRKAVNIIRLHIFREQQPKETRLKPKKKVTQWACDKFKNYITELEVILETNNKPLVSIFTTKHFFYLLSKLQRMRLPLAISYQTHSRQRWKLQIYCQEDHLAMEKKRFRKRDSSITRTIISNLTDQRI